jgi:MFS family permease
MADPFGRPPSSCDDDLTLHMEGTPRFTIWVGRFLRKEPSVAALLSTIALFTAGFLVRPLGAVVFGWLGGRVGRKYTFIMTLVGMALGTGAIGLIRPSSRSA